MRFALNFTPQEFQAKTFTPPISPNFNSFSEKKHRKMSENGEIYTASKNFTLSPTLTAWTNSTSELQLLLCGLSSLISIFTRYCTDNSDSKLRSSVFAGVCKYQDGTTFLWRVFAHVKWTKVLLITFIVAPNLWTLFLDLCCTQHHWIFKYPIEKRRSYSWRYEWNKIS